jgi:uncharacterized protein
MLFMDAYRSAMKLTLDADTRVNLIRSYGRDEVLIGDHTFRRSLIVTATALDAAWPPQRLEELRPEHLESIFSLQPQLVLLGTGATQRFPAAEIRGAFVQRRVGLEVMDLGAACRTFNLLVQDGRNVAAALLLT